MALEQICGTPATATTNTTNTTTTKAVEYKLNALPDSYLPGFDSDVTNRFCEELPFELPDIEDEVYGLDCWEKTVDRLGFVLRETEDYLKNDLKRIVNILKPYHDTHTQDTSPLAQRQTQKYLRYTHESATIQYELGFRLELAAQELGRQFVNTLNDDDITTPPARRAAAAHPAGLARREFAVAEVRKTLTQLRRRAGVVWQQGGRILHLLGRGAGFLKIMELRKKFRLEGKGLVYIGKPEKDVEYEPPKSRVAVKQEEKGQEEEARELVEETVGGMQDVAEQAEGLLYDDALKKEDRPLETQQQEPSRKRKRSSEEPEEERSPPPKRHYNTAASSMPHAGSSTNPYPDGSPGSYKLFKKQLDEENAREQRMREERGEGLVVVWESAGSPVPFSVVKEEIERAEREEQKE
ncbi:MAG: hypothetical protein Q9159_000279 [Coniocarpon cinnabarinum]